MNPSAELRDEALAASPDRTRLGLRWRVTLALSASIVVAVAAVAGIAFVLLSGALRDARRDAALEETRAATVLARREMADASSTDLRGLARTLESLGDLRALILRDGTAVSPTSLTPAEVPPELLDHVPAEPTGRATEFGGRDWFVTGSNVSPGTSLYLFFPQEDAARDRSIAARTLALSAVGVGLLGIATTAAVSRRVLAPMERTARAARRIAAGALSTRLPEDDSDYTDLTETFNEMAAALEQTVHRLESAAAAQRRFVADVSHELKTPVTALSTATDLLEPALERLDGPPRRAAELLIEEVRRMRGLVDDLMEISRLDAGVTDEALTAVRLDQVVPHVIEQRADGADVQTAQLDPVAARADPRRVMAVIGNLVENALRHGGPPVVVRVFATDGHAVVEVTDHGPGIPQESAARVFERFAKLDPARPRVGGSGLGLAIARTHARHMGGDVSLVQSDDETTFRFTLEQWQG